MSVNYIGDDGITAVSTALTKSRINKLWFERCGITLAGARSLAALLSVNKSISELWLHDNFITTEEFETCLPAVNNEACQVHIDDKYDRELQKMMTNLEDRREM